MHLGTPETFILTLFLALKWSDFCLRFFYVIFDHNKPPFVSLYCFEIGPKSGRQDWGYKGAKIHLSGLTVCQPERIGVYYMDDLFRATYLLLRKWSKMSKIYMKIRIHPEFNCKPIFIQFYSICIIKSR